MEQTPDRKRLRSEYLRNKRRAYARMVVTAALGLLGVILAGGLLVMGSGLIMKRWPLLQDVAGCGFIIGLAFVPRLVIEAAARRFVKWKEEADRLVYVPPVTPNSLPAEEILVRGSEQPAVEQRTVLLRAATAIETPHEQLLRVTNADVANGQASQ